MPWTLFIRRQERGTKREVLASVDFDSRSQALAAVEKLEDDIKAVGENDLIIVVSTTERVSFLKQDFRATEVMETGGDLNLFE